MRGKATIVLVLVAMLWVASPALACLLPGRAMTPAEHACCQQMAKMCGAMKMPQSHSCCQKEPASSESTTITAHHSSTVAFYMAAEFSSLLRPREFAALGFNADRPPNDSPPGLSVLRI